MFRPITIFPFPMKALRAHAENPNIKACAVVEMSNGQMLEDVKWATLEKKPVEFFARNGGIVPNPQETMEFLKKSYEKHGGTK